MYDHRLDGQEERNLASLAQFDDKRMNLKAKLIVAATKVQNFPK